MGPVFGRSWCFHAVGLQGHGLQSLSTEAFALNVEHRGTVKDPIQRTQQVILISSMHLYERIPLVQ